jgi:glutamine synthetase
MAAIICWPLDIDMEPVPGYKAASWSQGYGDFVLKIDLSTLRRIPWLEKTALVICDIQDHHHHEDLPHSPRAMLRKQVARLKERGYIGYFASELEFYLVKESYDSARAKHWQNLNTASPYIGDYQIGITTKEETVMRRLRNEMNAAGIPIENSKGEWGPGQEEINVRYAEALEMADRHVVLKNGAKEIAEQEGKAITFMAKYNYGLAGNSSPHPQFFVERRRQDAAVLRQEREVDMSELGQQWSAGQLKYAKDFTWFLCALHQLLQALPVGHFRADQDHVVGRQPHRRLPVMRRRDQGHPHGMPHRRRRSQPLSRLRCADRGRLRASMKNCRYRSRS